jgi:hypothetical protein
MANVTECQPSVIAAMEATVTAKNSFDRFERFAIGNLVRNRCRELDLGRADLIRRTNYKNVAKGLRR